MKKCTKCKEVKPSSDYVLDSSKKDRLSVYCRGCKSAYKRGWGKANKKRVSEYNQSYRSEGLRQPRKRVVEENKCYIREKKMSVGVCMNCGFSEYPEILHYHHLNPGAKVFALSRPSTRNLSEIDLELQKCVLLCPTCHAIEHLKGI